MFCWWNKLHIKQCIVTHRKHVKRRTIECFGAKRQFSSGKYSKLGNLYARLGLSGDVSQTDIKEAYYKLSKEHHPDRTEGCTVSTEKFRSITEAYEILGNVTTRAEYDRGKIKLRCLCLISEHLIMSKIKFSVMIFIYDFNKNYFFSETTFGRLMKRVRYKPQRAQPSSAFSEKDEELNEKIRTYRENMRRKTNIRNDDEEYAFRRENVFDFEAWYRAHFQDDFDSRIRDERRIMYAKQYRVHMERIAKGYKIRPPIPHLQRKERSDIDEQILEMQRKELRENIKSILLFGLIFTISSIIAVSIIQNKIDEDKGPWVDQYNPPTKPVD